jgi:hypothetical protein
MRTPNVQQLCLNIWNARDAGSLTNHTEMLTQMIYVAVAADLAGDVHYEVESDRRLQWLWQIITKRRENPYRMPYAIGPLEDTVQFLLFEKWPVRVPSGRELAVGDARN